MMIDDDYWEAILSLPSFGSTVSELTVRSVVSGLSDVRRASSIEPIPWNRALFAASLVTTNASGRALDGALRIAQGCLRDADATDEHYSGARFLLERLGNSRAVELAQRREILADSALYSSALPLELETIRNRIRLTISTSEGVEVRVNEFQRKFWDAARDSGRVSASAPTSAGKSFIVKLWLQELFAEGDDQRAAYVVPTRALVEEVTRDMELSLRGRADVFSLPWDKRIQLSSRHLFVVTQERLHLLQQRDPNLRLDAVFIDEAQKFGDGARGVLLQRVVDEVSLRNHEANILFASPLTLNPEVLLRGSEGTNAAVSSEVVMVNQNLIYANQVRGRPKEWTLEVVSDGAVHSVGFFQLASRPAPASKRLPLVAAALGRNSSGNVVYANTASEAEEFAQIIADSTSQEPITPLDSDPDIIALVELIQKTVHPSYSLVNTLSRGVAYHYGNMPLLVRQEVERMFRIGKIRYLVCTSTLLEGVNLPCQNIFVSAPRKGNGNPMQPGDFWNLAGRAGRWGKEFEGNIVCVDTKVKDKWTSVPNRRTMQKIKLATDELLTNVDLILDYDRRRSPLAMSREQPGLEALHSLIASRVRRHLPLREASWMDELPPSEAVAVENQLSSSLSEVQLPEAITSRHAGISPHSMQRLSDRLRSFSSAEDLELTLPEDADSVVRMTRVMALVDENLGGKFGSHNGRHWQLSILLTDWMRGRPLAYLIAERVSYRERTDPKFKLPSVIREVLADVEEMARFQAPLYFSCYMDVLNETLHYGTGRQQDQGERPDFFMMLELGVSRVTELSMMAIGLSRTTAVALGEHIAADNLSPDGCIAWLEAIQYEGLDLPRIVVREIRENRQNRDKSPHSRTDSS